MVALRLPYAGQALAAQPHLAALQQLHRLVSTSLAAASSAAASGQHAATATGAAAGTAHPHQLHSDGGGTTHGGRRGQHRAQQHQQHQQHQQQQQQQPMLYREFIQQSLYHPTLGYFNQPAPPLRRLPQPLQFHQLLNKAEYKMALARAYQQLQVDWLTPVEVFAPWYGRAIAHYMAELRRHSSLGGHGPLTIIEVGGGTGTLAASILDYMSERDPVTYSNMSYTTIEISSSLAAAQQQHIAQVRGHQQPWRLVRGDASQRSTWDEVAAALPRAHSLSQHCFVLMMEVLDNLPHDRVVRADLQSPWQQVMVAPQPGTQQQQQLDGPGSSVQQQQQQQQQHVEQLAPVTDLLVQRCLDALFPSSSSSGGSSGVSGDGSSNSSSSSARLWAWLESALGLASPQEQRCDVWLPTRCLQFLDALHGAAPHHTLIAADFSALPDVRVGGRNAPLVSGRPAPGVVRDYDSVLVPWCAADIFFPTDFDGLSSLYAASAAVAAAAAAAAAGDGAAAAAAAAFASGRGAAASQPQPQAQPQPQPRPRVSSSHSATGEFMAAFAEAKHTRTLTGYNPLVQDWQNTRVFVGQAVPGCRTHAVAGAAGTPLARERSGPQ